MLQLHTIERRSRQILQFEARSTERKKVLSPYVRPFVRDGDGRGSDAAASGKHKSAEWSDGSRDEPHLLVSLLVVRTGWIEKLAGPLVPGSPLYFFLAWWVARNRGEKVSVALWEVLWE